MRTERGAWRGGLALSLKWAPLVFGTLALTVSLARVPVARAATRHEARVLLVHEPRVYLAAPDSGLFEKGARLAFKNRGKPIATAEVDRVLDSALVVATITSGTLRRVKHPERLHVTVQAPLVRSLPLLRIGFPGATRTNRVTPCGLRLLRLPSPRGLYRVAAWSERSWSLVRDSSASAGRPWPDTLVVRLFDEAADEEIALERGELDAALFWPGEPSRYILDRMGGGGPLSARGMTLLAGPSLRGYLGAMEPDSIASLVKCVPTRRTP